MDVRLLGSMNVRIYVWMSSFFNVTAGIGTFIELEDLNVQKTRHPNINPNAL